MDTPFQPPPRLRFGLVKRVLFCVPILDGPEFRWRRKSFRSIHRITADLNPRQNSFAFICKNTAEVFTFAKDEIGENVDTGGSFMAINFKVETGAAAGTLPIASLSAL